MRWLLQCLLIQFNYMRNVVKGLLRVQVLAGDRESLLHLLRLAMREEPPPITVRHAEHVEDRHVQLLHLYFRDVVETF